MNMPPNATDDNLEERIEALLAADTPADGWKEPLRELFQRYVDQQRLLDRLTHIADRFQAAERERSQGYLVNYEKRSDSWKRSCASATSTRPCCISSKSVWSTPQTMMP